MPAKPRPRAAGRTMRPVATPREQPFQPLVLTSTPDEEREPVGRVPLFYIDGTEYTIPERLPFNLALRIMRTQRYQGLDAAMVELLEEAMGPEAFLALSQYRDLQPEQLTELYHAVRQVVLGGMEGPKVISSVG